MSRCDAEEFLRSRGPCAVPLRICCVAALVRAGETEFGCPELATTTGLVAAAASGAGDPVAVPASAADRSS
jgi:hypothetical protein